MSWSDDTLTVSQRTTADIYELNQAAANILLLCDGQHTVSDVAEDLAAAYGGEKSDYIEDAAATARNLLDVGLVERQGEARPLLYVAFRDFWDGFEERDNYFSNMIARSHDVMILPSDSTDPDLVFVSEGGSLQPRTHDKPGSSEKVVFVATSGTQPETGAFDFVFWCGGRIVDPDENGRLCALPLWAMYTDWEGYDRYLEDGAGRRLPEECHPDKVWGRLLECVDQE